MLGRKYATYELKEISALLYSNIVNKVEKMKENDKTSILGKTKRKEKRMTY